MSNINQLLFADAAIETLESNKTLPSKFKRMLKRSNLSKKASGKNVVIKMHFGSEIGFTTIHPVFVRTLIDFIKDSGAKTVKVMDSRSPKDGLPRGYTEEVLGCPVVNLLGEDGNYVKSEKIGFKALDEALLGGIALGGDVFIDLAHVKGHGDCGFGGALKNIAMGVVPDKTRKKLHSLEGGIEYDPSKCTYCTKCFNACPREAIVLDKENKKISFFFHHCTYCQHCVMVCPESAIKMEDRKFEDFSRGMALVTSAFLKKFGPENLFFINFLTNITMYCDCWGFSSPSLVPDIGILAGEDIAAIETASLDLIKTENLLPNGLPKDRTLVEGKHLFEKIHAKDPYLMVKFLEEYYDCSSAYKLYEIK